MTFGLIAGGPLQMLFSLLLMQGLSLTMWRSFLNQTIPRFNPLRFNLQLGEREDTTIPVLTTTASPALPFDPRLMAMMSVMPPILPLMSAQQLQQLQLQHLQQQQQQLLSQTASQSTSSNIPFPTIHVFTPPPPQVIVVPQFIPQQPQQQASKQGSASTYFPVQVEPPEVEFSGMSKRILKRPPKTTPRPQRVMSRMHAGYGQLHVSFVTPRVPAGYRRYIISPVTAKIESRVNSNASQTSDSEPHFNTILKSGDGSDTNISKRLDNGDGNDRTEANLTIDMTQSDISNSVNKDIATEKYTTVNSNLPNYTTIEDFYRDINHNYDYDTNDNKSTNQLSDVIMNSTNNLSENNISINRTDDFYLKDNFDEDFTQYIKNISNLSKIQSYQSPQPADEDHNEISLQNSKDLKEHTFKRVCYYQLDAPEGEENLKIADINPFICSHLIVGFASVSFNDLMVPRNPSEDPEKYRQLSQLKAANRRLKVMISVGDTSGAFSKVVASDKSRDSFVASALDICDLFEFDGIDIDWEFPSWKNGSKDDKIFFISLLKELRAEAIRRFRDDFLISVAVGAPLAIATASYDIPSLANVVDFVNLMSYDFHYYRADRPYTGHHSPLYPRPVDKGYFITLNAAWSATYWANKGMPLRKIILGVPTYARTFNLVVPISQGLDVPVNGPGLGGGKLNYTAVCKFLASGATREYDIQSQVPFAYKDYDWIAYENENSVALKARWVVNANMGGIMSFSLNFDDFNGKCRRDGKKFPLQKAISNTLELASIRAYRKISHTPDVTNYIN